MKPTQLELPLKPYWIHRYQILDALSAHEESYAVSARREKIQPCKQKQFEDLKSHAQPIGHHSAPSGNPYANINPEREEENEKKSKLDLVDFNSRLLVLSRSFKRQKQLTDKQIEDTVGDIHKLLWHSRNQLSEFSVNENPIRILNPEIAFTALGFKIERPPTLGTFSCLGRTFEVAGQIDQPSRTVEISQQFSRETQYFTAAHELAHAFLHEQPRMHRDRPLNGTQKFKFKDIKEWQADRFATYYLMPSKLIKNYFHKIFLTHEFKFSTNTAHALNFASMDDLIQQFPNLRELSRFLASTSFYNSKPVRSMSEIFNVSVEAMAIRLEELQLVSFSK